MLTRMSLPESLQSLLDPRTYPHPCDRIELIETHISWVLLTGAHAYKVKKPVRFSFIDFSTLALREQFCREELRCNRPFAPTLYEGVVRISRRPGGGLEIGGSGEVVDWAVQMRQFDTQAQLDRMLERGELQISMLRDFGAELAIRQRALPRLEGRAEEVDARMLAPMEDNFTEIAHTRLHDDHAQLLSSTLEMARRSAEQLRGLMQRRLLEGAVRECHGDLHLSNLALIDSTVTAFDCLEFNANLRWIDTMSDVAFLFMDCHVRGRTDLAYGFLDGYLDESGDYEGARLLGYFCAYRSMVRAKVAALRHVQSAEDAEARRFLTHLHWAHDWLARPAGGLVLMCGLSGSGKSYLAERLVVALPALRLRSDVARKARAGLASAERSGSPIDEGLYSAENTEQIYAWLEDSAVALSQMGERVILDATYLERTHRARLIDRAAELGVPVRVLYCQAPDEVLRARITQRKAQGSDASEADLTVLDRQLQRFQVPGADEPVILVDTALELTPARLNNLVDRLQD